MARDNERGRPARIVDRGLPAGRQTSELFRQVFYAISLAIGDLLFWSTVR
jgi:hypothetical protein